MSTVDQNVLRQRQLTSEDATDRLGVDPPAIDVYSDKQTGTNTDRNGYIDLMTDIEAGEIGRGSQSPITSAATILIE